MSTTVQSSPATVVRTQPYASGLAELIVQFAAARVAVFGDLCLDAYWELDSAHQETSLETGLAVQRVQSQRYALGGAGNVAVNLVALGVREVRLIGVVGSDLFGGQVLREAARQGLATTGIQRDEHWQTMVYAKPIGLAGEERRLDFGAGNRLTPTALAAAIAALEQALAECDVLVINQQMGDALIDSALGSALSALLARWPQVRVVVDARRGDGPWPRAVRKLNVAEAARLLGRDAVVEPADEATARALAIAIRERFGGEVVLTRGERGLIVAEKSAIEVVPGVLCTGKTDPVGAGDTVVAVLAACLAVGGSLRTAGRLANLAAAVTVRQLGTTGTATPTQLQRELGAADLVYEPELAMAPTRARLLSGSEIEVVRDLPPGRITHAIFDHDGTISTLRQGWEAVMEPMMLQAVLGDAAGSAPLALQQRAQLAVRELIDRTTGIQTLAQMQELVGLVRDFGCVPTAAIRDCHGYKKIYNDALLARIGQRLARLAAGEFTPADFIIRGSVELLQALHQRGVRIYLASGTDQADVAAEATALGYAHLFSGGILGAVGNLAAEAKRDIMERIVSGGGLDPAALLVVGDGPVEIREGRRRGARCIGIASDEPRRYGLDPAKRARLIRAGADVIVGDFIQRERLMPLLGFT